MTEEDLLTASQAAEALSASSQTIRNWIRAEQLHAVRIGNRFLIPRSEVDRLRGSRAEPPGESPWAFDPDALPAPLPRAGAGGAMDDSGDGILGG